MDSITLAPANPSQHFPAIADLMNTLETEPNTAETLAEWYGKHIEDGIWFTVALSSDGRVHGYTYIYRANLNIDKYYYIQLIVDEASRRRGIGGMLSDHLLAQASGLGACKLRTRVRDTSDEGIRFATRRGFITEKHSIEMKFDLNTWDESRYAPLLQSLRAQGFQFTTMAELGDTQEVRRKLYALNNGAAATDPGSDGIPPWASFEEFDRDVCNSYWYHPESQIIAVDSVTGEWAAMSAITVFEGADHAYNLFTGTDVRYRGRKLAQAVKSLALRWARSSGVDTVRTSHNSENAAMIAIDTKLGYVRTPGMLTMGKDLSQTGNYDLLISGR